MLDQRYHTISIIAIFLALGVGVIIGSALTTDDLLQAQQQRMVDDLEQSFILMRQNESQLHAENADQKQLISNYENLLGTALPELLKGQLAGLRIGLIISGGQEMPLDLEATMQQAGAQIVNISRLQPTRMLSEDLLRPQIEAYYDLSEGSEQETLQRVLAQSLTQLLQGQGNEALVDFLQNNGIVRLSGDYTAVVDRIVFLGGTDNPSLFPADGFDAALLQQLLNEAPRVVVAETSKIGYSGMKVYQSFQVFTVDHIDLNAGRLSLVGVLKGESGHFGIKDTATSFAPATWNAPEEEEHVSVMGYGIDPRL